MKTMSKRAWVLYVFIAAFLAGLIVLFYTFYTNADSWAMKKANRHLYSSGTLSVAGSIKDETGAVLAETKDGKRVYNSDKTVRTATMHTVGDSEGYIATGVQTSYKDVITGYNFVDGIYNLKKYGKGNDVNLTINAQLCAAAYSALGSNKGTVGVYNYKTGELLCAVTSPSYDPDNVPDVANDTTGSYEGVYLNRFFDASYTPGSIFKLVTAAAALETIPDVQSRTFQCSGKTIIGGQEIICNGVHGSLSLAGALAHSCNVAFGELAAELGAGVLQEYAEKLGLTGSISCEGYKTAPGKIDLSGADDGDVAWAGIGQYTDQVGALAFLRYMGAIANGGNAAEPYLMQRVRKGDDITYEAETKLTSAMIQPETAGTLTKLMRNDVQTIYGDWQFGGLSVCAKSGTAEREGQTANAMFALCWMHPVRWRSWCSWKTAAREARSRRLWRQRCLASARRCCNRNKKQRRGTAAFFLRGRRICGIIF